MCWALLGECEGGLRRYADGSDAGDCLTMDCADIFSFCYHRSVRRNGDMWGNTEIGVAHGRIGT